MYNIPKPAFVKVIYNLIQDNKILIFNVELARTAHNPKQTSNIHM